MSLPECHACMTHVVSAGRDASLRFSLAGLVRADDKQPALQRGSCGICGKIGKGRRSGGAFFGLSGAPGSDADWLAVREEPRGCSLIRCSCPPLSNPFTNEPPKSVHHPPCEPHRPVVSSWEASAPPSPPLARLISQPYGGQVDPPVAHVSPSVVGTPPSPEARKDEGGREKFRIPVGGDLGPFTQTPNFCPFCVIYCAQLSS